jgi:hypothetical protein
MKLYEIYHLSRAMYVGGISYVASNASHVMLLLCPFRDPSNVARVTATMCAYKGNNHLNTLVYLVRLRRRQSSQLCP